MDVDEGPADGSALPLSKSALARQRAAKLAIRHKKRSKNVKRSLTFGSSSSSRAGSAVGAAGSSRRGGFKMSSRKDRIGRA